MTKSLNFLFFFTLFLFSKLSFAEVKLKQGKAYNKNGKLVYIENHKLTKTKTEHKRKVEYINPKTNKVFSTLNVDYTKSLFLPDSSFSNTITGYSDKTKIDAKGESVVASFKGPKKDAKGEKSLKIQKDLVNIHGVHHYILKNFDQLLKGGHTKKFKLLVPAKLDYYGFKIYQEKKGDSEVTFKMEVGSWIIRMFASTLRLTYSLPDKEFIRFDGISNLIPGKPGGEEVIVRFSNQSNP